MGVKQATLMDVKKKVYNMDHKIPEWSIKHHSAGHIISVKDLLHFSVYSYLLPVP